MRTELFRDWHGRKRRWSDEQRTLIERLLDTLAQLATGLSVMQDRTLFVDAGDNPPREELRAALASFRASHHAMESIAARSADPRVPAILDRLADVIEREVTVATAADFLLPIRNGITDAIDDLGAIWRETR